MNNDIECRTISAGGAVVRRREREVELLLINDKKYPNWMLPKGHVEKGETLEEAAIREVGEETGLLGCKVEKKLGVYTRFKKEANEEKTVHIFLITAPSGALNLRPEFDNMQVKWFSLGDLPPIYVPYEARIIKDNIELILKSV